MWWENTDSLKSMQTDFLYHESFSFQRAQNRNSCMKMHFICARGFEQDQRRAGQWLLHLLWIMCRLCICLFVKNKYSCDSALSVVWRAELPGGYSDNLCQTLLFFTQHKICQHTHTRHHYCRCCWSTTSSQHLRHHRSPVLFKQRVHMHMHMGTPIHLLINTFFPGGYRNLTNAAKIDAENELQSRYSLVSIKPE